MNDILEFLYVMREVGRNERIRLVKYNKWVIRIISIIGEVLFEVLKKTNDRFGSLRKSLAKDCLLMLKCKYFIVDHIEEVIILFEDKKLQKVFWQKINGTKGKITSKSIRDIECQNIFNDILNSQHVRTSFFIKADHSDDIDEVVRLTIVSNQMLEYDSSFFEFMNSEYSIIRDYAKENYRPYFVEFYVDVEKMDERQKNFFRNQEKMESWFKAYFLSEGESKNEQVEGRVFEGAYAYSASPVVYKGRKLVITDEELDEDTLNKINVTYSLTGSYCSNDNDVKDLLETIFKNVVFNKVRVFKVGNGSCIYSYGKVAGKEKRLLYDIGFDNKTHVKNKIAKNTFEYQPALNRMRHFKPDAVIISHWDADHYKGCVYGEKSLFECMWIGPDNKDAGANAKRLGKYLYFLGKIKFVERGVDREIRVPLSAKNNLVLYVGKNGRDLTKINCEGIAVKHENHLSAKRDIACMMMGDVSYISLPSSANFSVENPYDYLIAPHHGSKMDVTPLTVTPNKDKVAVICCKNGVNRPHADHSKALQGCYSVIEITEDRKVYLQLNLRSRNDIVRR